MSEFICKIHPCVNNHEYQDGMCKYHFLYGGGTKPEKPKQKPIAKASKKRAKQNREDSKQNKEILRKNKMCQMKLIGCTGKAEGVHHMKGRTGQLLTDEKFKIPACNSCNRRAETHPKEALEKKVSISKHKKVA